MHDIENGFPGGTVVKSPPANAGEVASDRFLFLDREVLLK